MKCRSYGTWHGIGQGYRLIHFLTVYFIQGQHFRSDGAGSGSFTKGMGLNSHTTVDVLNKFQFYVASLFFVVV